MSGSGAMERLNQLGNSVFAQSAADGALPSLYAATASGVVGGQYFGPDGRFGTRGHPKAVTFVRAARDPAAARRLWTVSEELTGVRFSRPRRREVRPDRGRGSVPARRQRRRRVVDPTPAPVRCPSPPAESVAATPSVVPDRWAGTTVSSERRWRTCRRPVRGGRSRCRRSPWTGAVRRRRRPARPSTGRAACRGTSPGRIRRRSWITPRSSASRTPVKGGFPVVSTGIQVTAHGPVQWRSASPSRLNE